MAKLNAPLSLAAWTEGFKAYVDHIVATGERPYQHSACSRTSSMLCFPFYCGTCCVWSSCWRLLLCPFVACGGGSACGSNRCTIVSDLMITSYLEAVSSRTPMPVLPSIDNATPEEIDSLVSALKSLQAQFQNVMLFSARHYTLAHEVVRPLGMRFTKEAELVSPSTAMHIIGRIIEMLCDLQAV